MVYTELKAGLSKETKTLIKAYYENKKEFNDTGIPGAEMFASEDGAWICERRENTLLKIQKKRKMHG
jgi:hypothetical protein